MPVRRFLLACLALFATAIAWNAVVHLVLLRSAEALVRPVYRPDLAERMGLSLLVTAGVVVLFGWGYGRFARVGSLGEALRYGVFFALVAGVLVDLNQWVLLPIPGWLALLWFAGGLAEFSLYAVIVRKICPASGRAGEPEALDSEKEI